MIHDPLSPSSRNQRQPEQNDKKTNFRNNGMRPTRSTEELKRANSFKGFIKLHLTSVTAHIATRTNSIMVANPSALILQNYPNAGPFILVMALLAMAIILKNVHHFPEFSFLYLNIFHAKKKST